jgi:hypothetical protein
MSLVCRIVEEMAKGQKLHLALGTFGALHEATEVFIVTQFESESKIIYKLLL